MVCVPLPLPSEEKEVRNCYQERSTLIHERPEASLQIPHLAGMVVVVIFPPKISSAFLLIRLLRLLLTFSFS